MSSALRVNYQERLASVYKSIFLHILRLRKHHYQGDERGRTNPKEGFPWLFLMQRLPKLSGQQLLPLEPGRCADLQV